MQLALRGEGRGEIGMLENSILMFLLPAAATRLELTLTMLMGFRERW